MFARLLLRHGCRVACITPDPAALKEVLKKQGCFPTDSLCLLAIPEIIPPPVTHWQRIMGLIHCGRRLCRRSAGSVLCDTGIRTEPSPSFWVFWRGRAYMYARHLPEVSVSPDLPCVTRLKRRVLHVLIPLVWHVARSIRGAFQVVWPQRYNSGSHHPANLVASVVLAQNSLSWKPDFLFVMYADLWMTNPSIWRRKEIRVPIPWGGIRFAPPAPSYMGQEGYFLDPMFRGLCFLDEKAVQFYRGCHTDKYFEYIPDIVDAEVSPFSVSVCEELRLAAKGRPIVLLCGSIESRKNIRLFCEVARKCDDNSFFFAIIGQFHPSTYTNTDNEALKNLSCEAGDRSFVRDVYFKDEREMNSLIQMSDIIFAVYRDFRISSNMLSKAAYLRRPILVSERYLMGELVRRYGIGLTVDEDDLVSVLAALESLRTRPVSEDAYAGYCKDFSELSLKDALEKFIYFCLMKSQ